MQEAVRRRERVLEALRRRFDYRRVVRIALASAFALGGLGASRASSEIVCDTGVDVSSMGLFDAHDHFQVADVAAGLTAITNLADEGVSRGVLAMSSPDPANFAILLSLQANSATPVFAFAMPPTFAPGGVKTYTLATLTAVRNALGAGARGIGEATLRHSGPPILAADIPADAPIAMALYAEAASRGIPISIHFETRAKSAPDVDIDSRIEELRSALEANPGADVIWSHLGDTDAATVRSLIEEFDNLYADLSTRNPYYERGWPVTLQSLGGGGDGFGPLKPEWKELFEDHSGRFLFGLDLSNSDRVAQLDVVVAFYRGVLGELSQEAAEKIACKNAQVLLAAPSVPGAGTPMLLLLGALFVVTGVAWARGRRR